METSIIGKKYIPFDNSWSVNVTKAGDYPYKNPHPLLAGTNYGNNPPKECTIVSEPFKCNTLSFVVTQPKGIHTMIMVEYQEETYMVLFHKNCIKNPL